MGWQCVSFGDWVEVWFGEQGKAKPIGICRGHLRNKDISPIEKSYWVIKPPISSCTKQLNNSTMVMLNGKTYAPSSYIGSPHFTRMEKTACATFSDGKAYPTTKEVQSEWPSLMSVILIVYRSLTPLSFVQRIRRRISAMSWRNDCL